MHNVHASSDLDAIRPAIHRRFSLVGPLSVSIEFRGQVLIDIDFISVATYSNSNYRLLVCADDKGIV